MNKITSPCCQDVIIRVIDYGTLEGQLGVEKCRFCKKCQVIFAGEGKGKKFVPMQNS